MAIAWSPQGPIKKNTQAANPRKDKAYWEDVRPGGKWHIYAHGPRIKVTPKATPVAPSPATPAAPAASPLLPDSQYTAETGMHQARYSTALNDLVGQENRLSLDTGVDLQRGAGGVTGYGISPTVDVTNPFSQAALLQRAYNGAQRGTTNSYAAQGQLYAGSLQNAKASNSFDLEQGRDSLLKQFQDNLLQIGRQRTDASSQLQAANLDAMADLLNRRTQEAPVDPGPAPAPKPGFPFVSKSGARAGLSYKIIKRKSGNIRRYEDGFEEPQ